MKALVKRNAGVGLVMEELPVPAMGPNDVMIKISKVSVCGTDLHIYNWDEWAENNLKPPFVIGHEFVGTVVDIGKEVTSYFKLGDRVSGENHISCFHCRNCRAGRAHLCRVNVSVGVTCDGSFADYLVIPAANAYPIPNTISDDVAAILNPFGNSVHTALSFDLVGEDVLITGAGPVGIMAAGVARHAGARHVVITDVNPYRLKLAEKCGVTLAVNPNITTLDNVMKQLNMKEGFDVGLEMSGNIHAFNGMIDHMNHNGKIALLGFLPKNAGIDWSQIIMKGIIIKGIYGREMYDTWYKMTTILQSGLDISPIITHHYDSKDYQKVFDTMLAGEAGKIIVNW